MKKYISVLFIGIVLLGGKLLATDRYNLNLSDVNYQYNYKKDICEKQAFDMKKYVVLRVRDNEMLIVDKIRLNGESLTVAAMEIDGLEYTFTFGSSYGICKWFSDEFKDRPLKESSEYAKMKDPNIK